MSTESNSEKTEQTREQKRLDLFDKLAWQFNAEMPSDVMLKGDGSIWIVTHGDTKPHKISQQKAIELIYTAIHRSMQLASV